MDNKGITGLADENVLRLYDNIREQVPTLAWVAVIGFWAKQQGSKLNDYARN
jgi:hypothetical protein